MKLLILIFALFAICYATSIKDEIMMRVEQINQIKDKFAEARAGFQNIHAEANNRHNDIQNLMKEVTSKRMARASPECLKAVGDLVTLVTNSTCTSYFTTYFSLASTEQQRTDAINNFCSTCQTQYRDSVASVINQCNVTDFSNNYSFIKAVGFYQRFLCSKDDKGNLCAVVLNRVVSNIPSDITQVTSSQLDTFCSPCILKALTIIQAASGVPVAAAFYNSVIILKAACVKFNGVYCILKLKDITKQSLAIAQKFATNQTVSSSDITTLLDAFCTPCFRLVAARLSLSTNGGSAISVTAAFSGLGPLCRKNPAKQYCLAVLFDIAKNYFLDPKGIPCDFSNSTSCSQSCKDLISNLVNKGGCCWAVLVDTISGVGPGADSQIKDQIYSAFRTCVPNLKIPDPCPSVAKANFKLVYANIQLNWVQNNLNTFLALVKADLQRSTGGLDNPGNYTTSFGKRDTVTVNVNGATTTATAGGALAAAGSCDSVCANGVAADPNADITLSATVSDLSITSSSNIINFSVALLFIVSLFFF